jgi:hypothetical protein
MKNIPKIRMNPTIPNFSAKVTFYPVKDDYIHISRAITSSVVHTWYAKYFYRLFLLINVVCFPLLLFLVGAHVVGLAVFAVNTLAFIILVPINQKKYYANYYDKIYEDIEEYPVEIELTAAGMIARGDGSESLTAWKSFTAIQQSPSTIYFFTKSGGLPVRRSGFGSDRECAVFVEHARNYIRAARAAEVEPKPVPSITS